MRKMKSGDYIIDDVRRCRIRHGNWERFVLECYEIDPFGTEYVIPQDPGPAAKRATQLFCRRLAELGIITRREVSNRGKLDRFRPFASVAENAGVFVLEGCANDYENKVENNNDFYYDELEKFDGTKSGTSKHGRKDDMVDATSSAFTALATKTVSLSGISKSLTELNSSMNISNPFSKM